MKISSETLANVALVVMSVVFTGVAVDRYVLPRFRPAPDANEYRQGQTVTEPIRAVLDKNAAVTAVLVVSQRCKFCLESVDFYRRLVGAPGYQSGRFRIIFTGFETEDARAFVKAHLLPEGTVVPTPAGLSQKVRGTPTLLLINESGRVMGNWKGKLNQTQEYQVLSTVDALLAKPTL